MKPKTYFNTVVIQLEDAIEVVVEFRVDHLEGDMGSWDSPEDFFGYTDVEISSITTIENPWFSKEINIRTDEDVEFLDLCDIHTFEDLYDFLCEEIANDATLWSDY